MRPRECFTRIPSDFAKGIKHFFKFFLTIGEIHLCEKESTNISCDNDSVVFIEDVTIRPLPYNTAMMKDNNSLDEELKLTIQGICNDTYHCYLNNSFGDLTYSIPQLPRLLNVTYRCGRY